MYKGKDMHARGVTANMRSVHKISALNTQVRHMAARAALVTLGAVLGRRQWEWSLLELAEDDIRGLPQSTFGDPERQKGKKLTKQVKRARLQQAPEHALSWIWITCGKEELELAVQIEWAKMRARASHWREEVDLLEEKMWCTQAFHLWRTDWWREQIGHRGLEEGPQLEGETAYALRQASIQEVLAERCAAEWQKLPELIQRGRHGDGVVEAMDSDDEGRHSDEEEEPIPGLPQRVVKGTYTDKVLAV
ncbi:hypothetical protein DFH07DRAFT_972971 [Mycena maculata]|uniref:Uncharacterized protein n=1 Tax=Mycena maculata TaxID=230809 RepID=A0AAD7HG22_9AGAR|nr:hypothetical protein DFH07DRAFT_972971 [Mycena maculata]